MNILRLARAIIILAVLGSTTAYAQGVRILRASYGVQGQAIDVTGRLQAHVNRGDLSFPVTNRFFGVDPAPGRNKGVAVTYLANGRQFTQQATEGSTFVFRHVGGPPPPPPVFAPRGEIRFLSQSARPMRIYRVNRWGGWEFVTSLTPGARWSSPAAPGTRYVVTDFASRVLRSVTAQPGGQTVILR